jgi:hypothetical protein
VPTYITTWIGIRPVSRPTKKMQHPKKRRIPVTYPAGPNDPHASDEGLGQVSAYPGVVAGAVLRSARLSAGISKVTLARSSRAEEETVEAWEQGSSPLAALPLLEVEALKALLRDAGAHPDIVADLATAAWCDLVILTIADHEDPACLMADPATGDPAFGELLTWSVAGHVPARYRPYVDAGPLLTDLALIKRVIQTITMP